MREMEKALGRLLGVAAAPKRLRVPQRSDLQRSDLAPMVFQMYRELGGILPETPLQLRRWDLEFDGVAVELDEYLHFNRYRAITLRSALYERLPAFPVAQYSQYCVERESACLSAGGYGGKWSNPSCVKQFGAAQLPKDLTGNGAPRWRQRALYDFVKDFAPFLVGTTVVRIAIWDQLPGGLANRTVADALKQPTAHDAEAMIELIRQRTG
jgi:hypothetical protein